MIKDDQAAALRSRLLDVGRCPVCSLPLATPSCRWCGADLAGPQGRRLLELAELTADALAERDDLLAGLRAEARGRRAAAAQDADAEVRVPRPRVPAEPLTWGPQPVPVPLPAEPPGVHPAIRLAASAGTRARAAGSAVRRLRGPRAAVTVVTVVVLLSASAAVMSAGTLGGAAATTPAAGAAGLIALILVATGAAWLSGRRRSASGAVAVVLVLGDVWLVRAAGLLGADEAAPSAFLAGSVAASGAILLIWGMIGRLRAALATAMVLLPASPAVLAWWIASGPGAGPARRAGLLAAGLLAGALLATVRGARGLSSVERWLARGTALVLSAGAVVATAITLPDPATSGLAAAATALVVLVQSVPDRRTRLRRVWQLAAAALAPVAVGLALHALPWPAPSGASSWWPVALGAAVTATGLTAWARRHDPFRTLQERLVDPPARAEASRHRHRIAVVAHAGAGLTALPLVVVSSGQVATVLGTALPPWRYGVGLVAPGVSPVPQVTAAAALLVTAALLRWNAPRPVAWIAAWLAGTALVAGPLSPGVPLWVSLLLLGLVAVGVPRIAAGIPVTAGSGPSRHAARTIAVAAAVVGVVVGWSVAVLAVPATLAGAVGLLAVRRHAGGRARPWLLALATSAVSVSAGAVAALLPPLPGGNALVVAGLAALIAVAVAVVGRPCRSAPTPDAAHLLALDGADRAAVVVTGGLTSLVALSPAAGARPDGPFVATVLGLLLAAAVTGRALPAATRWGPQVLSAAVPPLLAATVCAAASTPARAAAAAFPGVVSSRSLVVLAATAAVALAAVGVGLSGRFEPGDPRRRATEGGTLLAAAGCSVAAVTGTGVATWWGVAVCLVVALAGAAIPPDRRALAWPAALLAVVAVWIPVLAAQIRAVEAYTLPAAAVAALLASVVATTRPSLHGRVLRGALVVAVVPGVLLSAAASTRRPLAWLAVSAVLLLVAVAVRRARRPQLLAAGAAAALAGTVHALGEVVRHVLSAGPTPLDASRVELWSLPGVVLVGAYAVVCSGLDDAAAERLRPRIGVPLLLLVAGPTALAAVSGASVAAPSAGASSLRAAGLLLGGAAVVVAGLRRPGHPMLTGQLVWRALSVAGLGAVTGALVQPPLELWSTSLGALLVVAGVVTTARTGRNEWWTLTPGVMVLLLPGVWLVWTGHSGAHPVVALALGGAVLLAGRTPRRWPLVVGGSVALVLTVVRETGPWLLAAVAALPRWADLALVAAAMVGLGVLGGRRRGEPADRSQA